MKMKRFMNEENKGNKLPLFIMQMVFLSFTLVILVCLLPFFFAQWSFVYKAIQKSLQTAFEYRCKQRDDDGTPINQTMYFNEYIYSHTQPIERKQPKGNYIVYGLFL